jgi:outer membrane murein-binding lipoprotein Lpp
MIVKETLPSNLDIVGDTKEKQPQSILLEHVFGENYKSEIQQLENSWQLPSPEGFDKQLVQNTYTETAITIKNVLLDLSSVVSKAVLEVQQQESQQLMQDFFGGLNSQKLANWKEASVSKQEQSEMVDQSIKTTSSHSKSSQKKIANERIEDYDSSQNYYIDEVVETPKNISQKTNENSKQETKVVKGKQMKDVVIAEPIDQLIALEAQKINVLNEIHQKAQISILAELKITSENIKELSNQHQKNCNQLNQSSLKVDASSKITSQEFSKLATETIQIEQKILEAKHRSEQLHNSFGLITEQINNQIQESLQSIHSSPNSNSSLKRDFEGYSKSLRQEVKSTYKDSQDTFARFGTNLEAINSTLQVVKETALSLQDNHTQDNSKLHQKLRQFNQEVEDFDTKLSTQQKTLKREKVVIEALNNCQTKEDLKNAISYIEDLKNALLYTNTEDKEVDKNLLSNFVSTSELLDSILANNKNRQQELSNLGQTLKNSATNLKQLEQELIDSIGQAEINLLQKAKEFGMNYQDLQNASKQTNQSKNPQSNLTKIHNTNQNPPSKNQSNNSLANQIPNNPLPKTNPENQNSSLPNSFEPFDNSQGQNEDKKSSSINPLDLMKIGLIAGAGIVLATEVPKAMNSYQVESGNIERQGQILKKTGENVADLQNENDILKKMLSDRELARLDRETRINLSKFAGGLLATFGVLGVGAIGSLYKGLIQNEAEGKKLLEEASQKLDQLLLSPQSKNLSPEEILGKLLEPQIANWQSPELKEFEKFVNKNQLQTSEDFGQIDEVIKKISENLNSNSGSETREKILSKGAILLGTLGFLGATNFDYLNHLKSQSPILAQQIEQIERQYQELQPRLEQAKNNYQKAEKNLDKPIKTGNWIVDETPANLPLKAQQQITKNQAKNSVLRYQEELESTQPLSIKEATAKLDEILNNSDSKSDLSQKLLPIILSLVGLKASESLVKKFQKNKKNKVKDFLEDVDEPNEIDEDEDKNNPEDLQKVSDLINPEDLQDLNTINRRDGILGKTNSIHSPDLLPLVKDFSRYNFIVPNAIISDKYQKLALQSTNKKDSNGKLLAPETKIINPPKSPTNRITLETNPNNITQMQNLIRAIERVKTQKYNNNCPILIDQKSGQSITFFNTGNPQELINFCNYLLPALRERGLSQYDLPELNEGLGDFESLWGNLPEENGDDGSSQNKSNSIDNGGGGDTGGNDGNGGNKNKLPKTGEEDPDDDNDENKEKSEQDGNKDKLASSQQIQDNLNKARQDLPIDTKPESEETTNLLLEKVFNEGHLFKLIPAMEADDKKEVWDLLRQELDNRVTVFFGWIGSAKKEEEKANSVNLAGIAEFFDQNPKWFSNPSDKPPFDSVKPEQEWQKEAVTDRAKEVIKEYYELLSKIGYTGN